MVENNKNNSDNKIDISNELDKIQYEIKRPEKRDIVELTINDNKTIITPQLVPVFLIFIQDQTREITTHDMRRAIKSPNLTLNTVRMRIVNLRNIISNARGETNKLLDTGYVHHSTKGWMFLPRELAKFE